MQRKALILKLKKHLPRTIRIGVLGYLRKENPSIKDMRKIIPLIEKINCGNYLSSKLKDELIECIRKDLVKYTEKREVIEKERKRIR